MHTPATLEAARRGADLVVWPEASGWVAPDDAAATPQLDGVRAVAERAGVSIVWSYFIRIDPNHTRNELLVVVTPDGRMSQTDDEGPSGVRDWRAQRDQRPVRNV